MGKTISLMSHQKEAIDNLKNGSILCGGVGTGKSMTALAYYYLVVCTGILHNDCVLGPMIEPKPLYIITTARKRDTKEWDKELERFDLKGVVVDSWNNLHKYTGVKGAFFIFDEQRVGGSGAWVKAFWKVARKNQWILLSATPGDTWEDYIPVFVANGFYGSRWEFMREHAVFSPYVTKFPKIDHWVGVEKLEKLRRRITVDMTYNKKTVRHYRTVLDTYDKALYDKVAKERWDPWKNEPIKDIAGACYLMRRAANSNPRRAENVLWITMNSITQKSIVFYNFDYELELIKEVVEDKLDELREDSRTWRDSSDFKIAEWNGHKHDPIPDSKAWIYLVQYNAGAEGWNCVETDTMIFYSRNYSYKMMEQAAGRIDRMNTKFEDLNYYVMATEAPIDRAIEKALQEKKNFNEKRFWAKDVEVEKVDRRRSQSFWHGYMPVVQLRSRGIMVGSPRPLESLQEAVETIRKWKKNENMEVGGKIDKAWIEVYQHDKKIRVQEVDI